MTFAVNTAAPQEETANPAVKENSPSEENRQGRDRKIQINRIKVFEEANIKPKDLK